MEIEDGEIVSGESDLEKSPEVRNSARGAATEKGVSSVRKRMVEIVGVTDFVATSKKSKTCARALFTGEVTTTDSADMVEEGSKLVESIGDEAHDVQTISTDRPRRSSDCDEAIESIEADSDSSEDFVTGHNSVDVESSDEDFDVSKGRGKKPAAARFNANAYVNTLDKLPFEAMIGKSKADDEVCVSVPSPDVSVAGDRSFLVDLEVVSTADLFIDRLGRWNQGNHRASQSRYYVTARGIPTSKENCEYCVIRKYANHPDAETKGTGLLRKSCWWILKGTQPIGFALVSYSIPTVCRLPALMHGNAKDGSAGTYTRTFKTSLSSLKEKRKSEQPSRIMGRAAVQSGETGDADARTGPRNITQIHNLSRSRIKSSATFGAARAKGLIEELYQRSLAHDSFVIDVSLHKGTDRCFCATKSMLESLKISCCASATELNDIMSSVAPPLHMDVSDLQKHFTDVVLLNRVRGPPNPIYLDMTFDVNLELYTIFVVYRHAVFQKRKVGRGGLCVGAVAFTTTRTAEDYAYVAEQLKIALGADAGLRLRCVVTDSEPALEGLFSCTLFMPPCKHLLCEIHLRGNTKRLLKGMAEQQQLAILREIYGSEIPENTVGRTRVQGICDAVSQEHFDFLVQEREAAWEALWPGFTKQFMSTQGMRIKSGYILRERFFAGLGCGRCTTNCSENTNKRFKQKLGSARNAGYGQTVDELFSICQEEYAVMARAVHGTGQDFVLSPPYLRHWVSDQRWNELDQKERAKRLSLLGIHVPQALTEEAGAVQDSGIALPPLLQQCFSAEERAQLILAVQQLRQSDQLQAIRGNTFILDINGKITVVRYKGEGILDCNCGTLKPLCAHVLALAELKGEVDVLLAVRESAQSSRTISEVRAASVSRDAVRKPGTRVGTPSSAKEQDRSVVKTVLLPHIPTEAERRLASFPLSIPTPQQLLGMKLKARFLQPVSERPPYFNSEPFTLLFYADLDAFSRQRSCVSCGKFFTSGEPPEPFNILLRHYERFIPPNQTTYTKKKPQQRYIHANLGCVLSRYHYFTTKTHLRFVPGTESLFSAAHKQLLHEQFGLEF